MAKRSPKNAGSGLYLNWWHGAFFLLGASVVALLHFMDPSIGRGSYPANTTPFPGKNAQPAPWGELHYTTIELERPDESFPDPPPKPRPIEWFFENYSQSQVEALFNTFDFTPAQKQALLDKTRWRVASNGWQVVPTAEVVRDMSLSARTNLYGLLQKCSHNFFIQNPVRIPAEKFYAWMEATGLPEDKQELLRKVVVIDGNTVNFYDSQLMELLWPVDDRKKLAKAIAQIPALLMQLRLTPETDVDALVRYWGRGGRGKAMRPFLESLTRVPGGASVSVSFFLPAFARMRLYTYPDIRNDKQASREDCFWTAMNFFNETPDYRYFDANFSKRALQTEYIQVQTNWAFGDLIMLLGDNDEAVHMCVYVADDVVFTKNGMDYLQPWVLMKIPEMMTRYPSDNPLRMVGFRRRNA